MSSHVEWVNAACHSTPTLVEPGDVTDAFGNGIDPGNVALAFGDVIVEGTIEQVQEFARNALLAVLGHKIEQAQR